MTQFHWLHHAMYQGLLISTGYTMLCPRTYSNPLATLCNIPGLTKFHWLHHAIYQDLLNPLATHTLYQNLLNPLATHAMYQNFILNPLATHTQYQDILNSIGNTMLCSRTYYTTSNFIYYRVHKISLLRSNYRGNVCIKTFKNDVSNKLKRFYKH